MTRAGGCTCTTTRFSERVSDKRSALGSLDPMSGFRVHPEGQHGLLTLHPGGQGSPPQPLPASDPDPFIQFPEHLLLCQVLSEAPAKDKDKLESLPSRPGSLPGSSSVPNGTANATPEMWFLEAGGTREGGAGTSSVGPRRGDL